ncbi:hypothetical protein EYF80_028558 [Liparis tanakae]|uniref:Uncharacterized protein n=1 Tax=Liparis tanakae TaxID=230148 RepID=A0A4Z2H8B2_9TELE|nr:hypothetical protein EYF80_028558 [Liparis tanakae]
MWKEGAAARRLTDRRVLAGAGGSKMRLVFVNSKLAVVKLRVTVMRVTRGGWKKYVSKTRCSRQTSCAPVTTSPIKHRPTDPSLVIGAVERFVGQSPACVDSCQDYFAGSLVHTSPVLLKPSGPSGALRRLAHQALRVGDPLLVAVVLEWNGGNPAAPQEPLGKDGKQIFTPRVMVLQEASPLEGPSPPYRQHL